MVVEAGQTIRERLAQMTQDSSLSDQQPILWAPIRRIEREFRCWMRGDELLQASQYKTGARADHRPVDGYDIYSVEAAAKDCAAHFTPAAFYCVDLGEVAPHDFRVVEYNCINCSGRYEIDRGNLFRAMLGD